MLGDGVCGVEKGFAMASVTLGVVVGVAAVFGGGMLVGMGGGWGGGGGERLHAAEGGAMELGNFSLSLAVKEIGVSRAFYEKLGFVQIGGDATQGWVIMQSGTTTIGLFQGMFERNMLTFNPGWNHKGEKLEAFTDVRELQRALIAKGIEPNLRADEGSTGPASFVIEDPDGNPILFDQHVGRE